MLLVLVFEFVGRGAHVLDLNEIEVGDTADVVCDAFSLTMGDVPSPQFNDGFTLLP